MSVIQVITTVPTRGAAEKMARLLVSRRLAACVQMIGPIESVYLWKGKIENAKEFICLIKTVSALYVRLEREIKANHPYEVPEIITVPVKNGSKGYLSWLRKSVG